jgi:hypothetical protein
MFATQAALPLPRDVLLEIDSFRRRRVRRAKTAHRRERLYLARKWAISLRRKAAALGADVWIPFPAAWDFRDGEFRHGAYFRELFAWFRAHGLWAFRRSQSQSSSLSSATRTTFSRASVGHSAPSRPAWASRQTS